MKARVLIVAVLALKPASALAADEPTASALIRQGADLFKREDYEGARAAFARAYELDRKPATLFNLGLAEVNSDHPVEAVAHLREYLTHSDEPAAKLDSVRTKWLPRAEARTARLNVYAPAGAHLAVDGVTQEGTTQPVGSTGPPVRTIEIASGEHEITAREGTVSESQHVTARGGELVDVHFQRVADAAPSPVTVGWVGGTETRDRAEDTAPRAKWITVVALGSAAVVGAGFGIGFGIASGNKASDVQSLHGEIAPGSTWTSAACGGPSPNHLCAQLKDDVAANRELWTLSAASYVAAGVLGAASLATWFWKPKSGGFVARPVVGARNAGFVLDGRW